MLPAAGVGSAAAPADGRPGTDPPGRDALPRVIHAGIVLPRPRPAPLPLPLLRLLGAEDSVPGPDAGERGSDAAGPLPEADDPVPDVDDPESGTEGPFPVAFVPVSPVSPLLSAVMRGCVADPVDLNS